MKRLTIVAIGLSVALAFLLGISVGKRTASFSEPEVQEASEHNREGKEHHDRLTLTREGEELAGIKILSVGYGEVEQTLEATGEVQPNTDKLVQVGSFVSGRISQLLVNVGDEVREGQILAFVDSTEVAQAQYAYAQAKLKLEAAKKRWENLKRLAQFGALTQRPLQEAQREYADASAQVAMMQAAVEKAQTALDLAKAELKRQQELANIGVFRYPPLQEAQKEFANAQSELEQAYAELISSQANLVRAETDFQLADRNADRAERLFQIGTLSKRDLEFAQLERQKAHSHLLAAQREVEAKKANLERAKRQLELVQLKLKREEEIANRNLYAQSAIQKAEAEVKQAEKELEQSKAELEKANMRLQIAKAALEREQRVAEQNLLAQRELQEAQAQYEQAKAELIATQNALRLLRVNSGQSARIPIIAPISGRIIERKVSLGQTVSADDVLFVILDLSSVWVDVRVFEKDIQNVKLGQKVTITTPAYPNKVFVGTVRYIGDVLDEKTRTLLIRCQIANPQRLLKPEMFVRARIQIGKRKGLVIPVTAYHEDDGKAKVYVQEKPNQFVEREVVLGTRSGNWVEVKGGLKLGEKIVAEGSFLLKSEERKKEFGDEH
ncbi:MAG: efflux RND transporter periplasmic adaptor subunit [Armatimonadetes bacterium]|nr:efflux RND transporter periplasmic adaptor subunit [Armatimonadota bacterium]